jgi:hypothetical protein
MSGSIDTIDAARLGTNGTIMSSVGAVLDTKYTPLVAIGYFAQSRGLWSRRRTADGSAARR